MCFPALLLLYGASGDFNNGSIVIEFPNSLNPTVEDGVVITGYAAVDSLNAELGAVDFEYYDLSWTTKLRYILVLYFDESRLVDVENEAGSYIQATAGLGTRVEHFMNPEVNSVPGEYLYSDTIYHPEDTLWPMYNDMDDKRNWRIFARLQEQDVHGNWSTNYDACDPWEEYYNLTNQVEVNEFNRPFPYKWAYHGHASLWHHLADYNNTYRAWDYTEGENTLAICLDGQGFWTQHPDLVDRWLPGYPQDSNHHYVPSDQTPATYPSWWSGKYHGTNCAGALAASKENLPESELTSHSSVGVAPQTMLLGRGHTSILDCLAYLHLHPELSPAVISRSHTQEWSDITFDGCEELISMGVTIVNSRGYVQNYQSFASKYGRLLEGYICVGDYNPDWKIRTKYDVDILNSNEDLYKADINAPGWDIWVPGIHHTYESGFTQIGYGLSMGTNTSIAAPQVAGVVCLVKSLYPWMSPPQVERQIKMGAHNLDELIAANTTFLPNTPPSFFGAGCLNAYSSLFLHGTFERNFVFSNEANNTALLGRGFTLSNSSMTVANGTLRIEKDANILFNSSVLILGDNVTVQFEKGAKLDLCPNSSLVLGNNVTFRTENNDTCLGLVKFGNNTQSITFNNTIFINVPIEINNTETAYNGCTFTRSSLLHNNEPLSINYCDFEFSGLQAIQTVPDPDDLCWIGNTEVSNSTLAGIQITGYSKVNIQNNNIHHNFSGIELYECSGGVVTDNEVSYNGNGILLYHSNADITGHNNITYNYSSSGHGDNRGGYGIDARHLTSWNLIGQDTYPIQIIHDNQREQILMQSNSIPSSMYFNKVYSSNHDKPYLRMWDDYIGSSRMINISNNNWSSDFIPTRDLSPESAFTYLPMWEPGIPLQVLEDEAFLLFEEAMSAANNMDYVVAEQKLKQIIAEYPETKVCVDASKQLLILVEKYNQNYEALELYYTTYPTLRNDPILIKMADYLANFCKMKSGDYPEAIQFFEDLILNPPSLPDSLFAVIDAGYAYLLMAQNSDKSSYVGDLKWLKPTSVSAYLNSRNALINNRLLVATQHSQETPDFPEAIRISNYPNPFNPNTTINFYLPEPDNVVLEVFNIKGQRVKTLINDYKEAGSHSFVWNGTDQTGRIVSSGVYFYRLSTGTRSIVKKMLLMK